MSKTRSYKELKNGDDVLFYENTADLGRIVFDGTIIDIEENYVWIFI